MAKYSSDSESDYSNRYRRKRTEKSRSTSTDSSESSPHRRRSSKYSKSKRRHRSPSKNRGRERDIKSYKRDRSASRDKRRYRSTRGRSRSEDRIKRKMRSVSRDESRSRSSSTHSNIKPIASDQPRNILSKDEFPIEPRFKDDILEEIDADSFTQKQFLSSRTKESKFKNIVIDVSADTIHIPTVTAEVSSGAESIFHSSIMLDQEARFDRWVKKLYTLRQKAIADLTRAKETDEILKRWRLQEKEEMKRRERERERDIEKLRKFTRPVKTSNSNL